MFYILTKTLIMLSLIYDAAAINLMWLFRVMKRITNGKFNLFFGLEIDKLS